MTTFTFERRWRRERVVLGNFTVRYMIFCHADDDTVQLNKILPNIEKSLQSRRISIAKRIETLARMERENLVDMVQGVVVIPLGKPSNSARSFLEC